METNEYSESDRKLLGAWLLDFAKPVGGWQCFHTATFKPENPARDEWSAIKRYRNFMQETERRRISWIAAAEPNPDHHRLNPGYHVHAVWADLGGEIQRTPSFKRWANQWGNNKVDAVRERGDVALYVAKYCVKRGCMIEWQANGELWHAMQGHHRPATQHVVTV